MQFYGGFQKHLDCHGFLKKGCNYNVNIKGLPLNHPLAAK